MSSILFNEWISQLLKNIKAGLSSTSASVHSSSVKKNNVCLVGKIVSLYEKLDFLSNSIS